MRRNVPPPQPPAYGLYDSLGNSPGDPAETGGGYRYHQVPPPLPTPPYDNGMRSPLLDNSPNNIRSSSPTPSPSRNKRKNATQGQSCANTTLLVLVICMIAVILLLIFDVRGPRWKHHPPSHWNSSSSGGTDSSNDGGGGGGCTDVVVDPHLLFNACYALLNSSARTFAALAYDGMELAVNVSVAPTECIAVDCNPTECIAPHIASVNCTAVPCETIQCTSVPCSTVPCISTNCSWDSIALARDITAIVNTSLSMISRNLIGMTCSTPDVIDSGGSFISNCRMIYSTNGTLPSDLPLNITCPMPPACLTNAPTYSPTSCPTNAPPPLTPTCAPCSVCPNCSIPTQGACPTQSPTSCPTSPPCRGGSWGRGRTRRARRCCGRMRGRCRRGSRGRRRTRSGSRTWCCSGARRRRGTGCWGWTRRRSDRGNGRRTEISNFLAIIPTAYTETFHFFISLRNESLNASKANYPKVNETTKH